MCIHCENGDGLDSILKLPPEVRMKIVDRMEADDRCRYSTCSKVSNQDAKSSKNYIYRLGIAMVFHEYITIYVIHAVSEDAPDLGYMLSFKKVGDKNIMTYFNQLNENTWRKELGSSELVVDHSVECFNNLLRRYQNNIKSLEVRGHFYGEAQFEITSLRRLENLLVHHNPQKSYIISKVQRPLQDLSVVMDYLEENPDEQVYHVHNTLFYPNLQLNNAQFQRLPESDFSINIGSLTVQDIFNFVQAWQNSTTTRKGTTHCAWFLRNSDFDVHELFDQLRLNNHIHDDFPFGVEVKHFRHPWKTANLYGVYGDNLQVIFDNGHF